jgi:hypothetical protein
MHETPRTRRQSGQEEPPPGLQVTAGDPQRPAGGDRATRGMAKNTITR